jgi:hypothetical protein
MNDTLKHAHLRVQTSSIFPELVTLRSEPRASVQGLREGLTRAGFQDGDRVVVLDVVDFDQLLAAVELCGAVSKCDGCHNLG